MKTTLIRARWIVASDGETHHLLENGELVFAGDKIVFTGHAYALHVDEVIDAGEAVVGPGFVDLDALFDLDSTVLGFDNHPGWKKARVWASSYVDKGPRDVYTPDEEAFQHQYAMVQLLLNGITTALPIRSLLYREWAETYDENARATEAAARLGIRMYLGPSYRTGLSMVHADGRFDLHFDEARGMHGLAEAVRFAQDFDGAHAGLIRGFLQPDRIECCTDELLRETAASAHRLNVPVRLHCCQSNLEVRTVHERWGKSSLEVLHDIGFLSQHALLPHAWNLGGIAPTPALIAREMDWLAQSGASVVQCPVVGARHGDVLRSFTRFREHGINIGLGTDTYPPDMVLNMHTGVMTARIADGDMRASAADYYNAATLGGANALGRRDLGRLMPGALADIVIFDLSNPRLGQVFDPIQAMVLNGSGRDVHTVIVNGRIVVRDGALPGVDLAAMHLQAQQQYQKLIASYPERAHLHPPITEIFTPSFPLRHE